MDYITMTMGAGARAYQLTALSSSPINLAPSSSSSSTPSPPTLTRWTLSLVRWNGEAYQAQGVHHMIGDNDSVHHSGLLRSLSSVLGSFAPLSPVTARDLTLSARIARFHGSGHPAEEEVIVDVRGLLSPGGDFAHMLTACASSVRELCAASSSKGLAEGEGEGLAPSLQHQSHQG
jgi:hypothetical protein